MSTGAQLAMDVAPVLPDYGTFPRTPANGVDWIHPEDVAIVDGLIPGPRVFCRYRFEDPYYYFRYGEIRFRLRPCLWLPVAGEGIDIGDQVETIGVGMQQELFVSEVIDMHFSEHDRRIRYRLARTPSSDRYYYREQLRVLTDKTHLRPSDTIYPQPNWDRQAYPPSDSLTLRPDGDTASDNPHEPE